MNGITETRFFAPTKKPGWLFRVHRADVVGVDPVELNVAALEHDIGAAGEHVACDGLMDRAPERLSP
jgi:hypothetical protein